MTVKPRLGLKRENLSITYLHTNLTDGKGSILFSKARLEYVPQQPMRGYRGGESSDHG